MRSTVAIMLGLAALPFSTISAWSEDGSQFLSSCPASPSSPVSAEVCRHVTATFTKDYRAALGGRYQGIRNVAYCRETGCDGAVIQDRVDGCAWRMIAIVKAPTSGDAELDRMQFHSACGRQKLANAERAQALSVAEARYRAIFKKAMPIEKVLAD